MNFISQIISQAPHEVSSLLLTYGPLGVISAWLMFRAERGFNEIRSLAHRIDGLTRALLMDMISRDNVGLATKTAARAEIAKIEARLPRED